MLLSQAKVTYVEQAMVSKKHICTNIHHHKAHTGTQSYTLQRVSQLNLAFAINTVRVLLYSNSYNEGNKHEENNDSEIALCSYKCE